MSGHAQDACALAPALYLNGAKVAAALRQLSETGEWDEFNAVFAQVLADAASMTGAGQQ